MRKAILSVVLTVAFGSGYIWLGILGDRPLARHVHAAVTVPNSHGVLVGTSVSVRGYKIGEVTSVQREAGGVRIGVAMDARYPIPLSSRLKIEQFTAFETYLDFEPSDSERPFIEDGAVILASTVSTPLSIPEVFALLNRLSRSISTDDLAGFLDTVARATDVPARSVANLAAAGAMVNQLIRSRSGEIEALSRNYGRMSERLDGLNGGILGIGSTGNLLVKGQQLLASFEQLMEETDMPNSLRQNIVPFLDDNGRAISSILAGLGPIVVPMVPVAAAFGDVVNVDLATLLTQTMRTVSGDGLVLTVAVPHR
ncbi:MCE family protein [Tsukamurella asaccharolytica]|uniref:MCE family protein n=1 Tax=Tsukamurella asaccharolytica TaxID=2592067 RepID=A0A5C5RAH5_9ACTN|nr:MlaD family protein [Tsukamurella asaccharolytica]TWS19095.1 MCE family protein [Tsukamurella asaccharolytica]